MLLKIKRQDCLNAFDKFPQCDEEKDIFIYPKVFKNYVLTLSSKTLISHGKNLGKEIIDFTKYFEFEKLIFLGDTNQYWLKQYNPYSQVKESYNYLLKNKINLRFNGGIEAKISDLNLFINRLFWLIRCNAAFPNVYFMDEKQTFLLHICKYGNVHLDVLDKKMYKQFESFLICSNFHVLDDSVCTESFSKYGSISGRKIIL